jgi:hypothetical protein
MRRAVACGLRARLIGGMSFWFYGSVAIEGVHPLQAGFFRRKYRRDRRPTLPRESPFIFYPRYAWEILSKNVRLAALALTYYRLCRRVEADPAKAAYRDLALTPVTDDELGELEIFSATESAKQAVEMSRRRKALGLIPIPAR